MAPFSFACEWLFCSANAVMSSWHQHCNCVYRMRTGWAWSQYCLLSLSLDLTLSIFSLLYVVGKLLILRHTAKPPNGLFGNQTLQISGDKLRMSNQGMTGRLQQLLWRSFFCPFFFLLPVPHWSEPYSKRVISRLSLWCCQSNPSYCRWIDPIWATNRANGGVKTGQIVWTGQRSGVKMGSHNISLGATAVIAKPIIAISVAFQYEEF